MLFIGNSRKFLSESLEKLPLEPIGNFPVEFLSMFYTGITRENSRKLDTGIWKDSTVISTEAFTVTIRKIPAGTSRETFAGTSKECFTGILRKAFTGILIWKRQYRNN